MKYQNIAILTFLFIIGIAVYILLIRPMGLPFKEPVAPTGAEFVIQKPVDGELRGVIEIGSTGFNAFIIHVDRQKRWEMVAKDFGVSLAYEGLATPEAIRQGVNRYMSTMFDNAVARKNIHIVVSSGAQKTPKVFKIVHELQKIGYRTVAVSATDEARYGFVATVPASMTTSAYFVDVGSGNTKVAWMEGDSLRSYESPGAKYFELGLKDSVVYQQIKMQSAAIPVSSRQKAFIIGGAPFMLAEKIRSGNERFTLLKDPGYYIPTNQRMASGINIYKAIADGTGTKDFIFDWDANFSIGYLLSLP